MDEFLIILREAGASADEIPRKEAWALLQAWREIYCAPVHAATGRWVAGGGAQCSWHTFSYEYFPCLKGRKAIAEYGAQPGGDFLVLTEGPLDVALSCVGSTFPDFTGLVADVYVTPPSLEWTMVFTHEGEAFGPYFARAAWVHQGVSGVR